MSNDDQYGGAGYGEVGGTGQTRTRLPEAPADPYGPARRTSRAPRSLVTVVGVVVLLIAAIAFANQAPDTPDAKPADDTPSATSTSPTGTDPVTGKQGGLPSGFAQDQQGAQSAAANYAVALGSDGMFNPARRRSIVDAMADGSSRTRLQTAFDADYSAGLLAQIGLTKDGLAPTGSTFVNRTVPAGAKVKNFSGGSASVDVWCIGMFGLTGDKSTRPVTSSWFTISMALKWNGSDWKVVETSQKDGPTPVTGDVPVSTSDEIGSAVTEFGGFTYAR
ncbi:hypothetical protein GCM10010215_60190 [Streptomyces virginiae]|uniref:DUF8175 domain-containing protein n=1 Tax=Streptomyces virginiae TaxID=1961 RepID=A0ABQ3NV37_STRVG|nr:hypothetical protein [Streptomyces virginiae]MBP2344995.1 hypothetical protein [Streptomyces virginiae]GGQ27936.1 hypothetical protein GCM10010215_60190 [Streptomyces virginiae]GHI16639.1 hypothetical protein Scinn_61020 [Streptomyces virginiae]